MITSIQFLRFIAAGLVVLTHSMREFPNLKDFGAFGVDIFFVISGFIISYVTQSNRHSFFVKRLIRIVPLYWLFTFALAVIAFAAPNLLRSARFDVTHILSSLFFLPYWTENTGFAPLLKLGWTLNYEIFFYLLFYISMKIGFAHREIICSILIFLVYFALSVSDLDKQSAFSFYSDSILVEFVFGMFLSLLYRNKAAYFRRVPILKLSLYIATVFFLFYFVTYKTNYLENVPRFILWGIPSFLCVYLFLVAEFYFRSSSERLKKLLHLSGDVSYPLYLIHIYFIVLLSRVFKSLDLNWIALFSISLLVSCIASYLVIRTYDVPVRKMLTRMVV